MVLHSSLLRAFFVVTLQWKKKRSCYRFCPCNKCQEVQANWLKLHYVRKEHPYRRLNETAFKDQGGKCDVRGGMRCNLLQSKEVGLSSVLQIDGGLWAAICLTACLTRSWFKKRNSKCERMWKKILLKMKSYCFGLRICADFEEKTSINQKYEEF